MLNRCLWEEENFIMTATSKQSSVGRSLTELKVRHQSGWFYIYRNTEFYPYLWQDGNWYSVINKLGSGRWPTRFEAERFLTNYERKNMSDTKVSTSKTLGLEARIDQITKDMELLGEEQMLLMKKIEDEKKYIFKEGDVAEASSFGRRVIVRSNSVLTSYNEYGSRQGSGQKYFEDNGYKKIGVLGDYLK